jgi:hypothetical protein
MKPVYVSDDVHRRLKTRAAAEGLTMGELVASLL